MRSRLFSLLLFALLTAASAAAETTDVSIQITQDNGPRVQVGTVVRYRSNVSNNGPDAARRVTITATRPEGAVSFRWLSFGLPRCSDLTCQADFIPPKFAFSAVAEVNFD